MTFHHERPPSSVNRMSYRLLFTCLVLALTLPVAAQLSNEECLA